MVQGQGRKGEMKFNNKKPGSLSALTFEMTEKHLKHCDCKLRFNIFTCFCCIYIHMLLFDLTIGTGNEKLCFATC